jgi:hypothetical protein
MTDDEMDVSFGLRPRTLRGFLFWLRYWSPPARWWRAWGIF